MKTRLKERQEEYRRLILVLYFEKLSPTRMDRTLIWRLILVLVGLTVRILYVMITCYTPFNDWNGDKTLKCKSKN